MRQLSYLLCLSVLAICSRADADLTIQASIGGYDMTVCQPSGGNASVSRETDTYKIQGTGAEDAKRAEVLANSQIMQMRADREKAYNKTLDRMVGSYFACAPQTVCQPVACPQPCQPCQPTLACTAPANGTYTTIYPRWVTSTRFIANGLNYDVPPASAHLFSHRPSSLTGWSYRCPSTGVLMFRDAVTCVDIRDP